MNKKNLCGLSPEDIMLSDIQGMNMASAIMVTNNIYKKRISDIDQFTKLSVRLKKQLSSLYNSGLYSPESFVTSKDGTKKYLFRNDAGLIFETVFMTDGKRNTVCVSSQSGCRMGCRFCATGKIGFIGDLSAGDILNQALSLPEAGIINHVVFMGMGEPFDNIENVIRACEILTAEWGAAISPRNITVSTVGIASGIEKFLKTTRCNLTLSLFSPFQDERRQFVPAEIRNPVSGIISTMMGFPVTGKRRFSVAYVMINGLNDKEEHLQGLKSLLKGTPVRINLIPYHQLDNEDLTSSSRERMMYFKHELVISGISASVRRSRGEDIAAACGLLASGQQS